jgi:stearoyl-CoA desaturase (delta-9 desaturase)
VWWELDITYGLLVLLSWLGIVRDLRQVPQNVLEDVSKQRTGVSK